MRCGTAALVLAGALFGPAPAAACGLHGGLPGDSLSAAHPASLPVALALYDATRTGRLMPPATLPPTLALVRAELVSRRLLSGLADPQPFSMLLIEGRLWSRLAVDGALPTPQTHVDGPTAGEPVLVTSEAALQALLGGTIGWDEAVAVGLAVVNGEPAAVARLDAALRQRLAGTAVY